MLARRTSPTFGLLGLALSVALSLAQPSVATAESSDWNLHLDPAFAVPAMGMLEPEDGALEGVGFFLWATLDWQLARPLALELVLGGGHVENIGPPLCEPGTPGCATLPDTPLAPDGTFLHGALGARLRFADDRSGYANQPGGSFAGNGWISAHVGMMAWNGPQLAIDAAIGYELSVWDPVQVGLFVRGVVGLFGDDDDVDLLLTAGLSLSFEVHTGVIPPGRYGVSGVNVDGLDQLDEAALRACLGTRARPRFGFDFGATSDLSCGLPPFGGGRWRVDLFAWPWTEWPLFDASVFERDVLRVERWLRARGYYEGRVVASAVDPTEALGVSPAGEEPDTSRCIADATRGCELSVSFHVEEGEPVRVDRVTVRGESEISRDLRARLRQVLRIRHGDVFDETLYEQTQQEMARVLANNAYPDAVVTGEVKINTERHEAYLLFLIRTGQPGVLGRVCVSGYGELPPEPIVAATFLGPGQPFSLRAIEEAQRAIFALGTLSSVEIRHRTEIDAPEQRADEDAEEATEAGEEAGDDAATDGLVDSALVPEAEPIVDAHEQAEADEAIADEAEDAVAAEAEPAEVPWCTEAPRGVPEGTRVVDLEIAVAPGRLERFGLGGGIQAGDTLSFGSTSAGGTAINQQALQQWDLHLLGVAEWRNLFGNMLRVRLEERPRLIFPTPFPGAVSATGVGPSLGNRVSLTIRWPAFIEARTALFAALTHDYGPIPLYGFSRHELDGRIGLERTFLDGRLYVSAAIRGNLFVPDPGQDLRLTSQRETTRALILEEVVTLDLRDDPRNPSEGALFSVGLQEAGLGGVSSWDYFRITAEARGYVPLGLGIVLAARFGIGAMFIGDRYGLDPDNIYDLYLLGPLSQQLQGGGSISNRGVPPGLLGDVVRRRVEARPLPDGTQDEFQPILVSGGIRRWEGSLEVRFPITPDIGAVVFADVGNVSRSEDFHFDVLNFAFGFGVRYRTIIGPLRFDWAFRPDALQWVGTGTDPRPRKCESDQDVECRPISLLFGSIPGAIHLTIGEAF